MNTLERVKMFLGIKDDDKNDLLNEIIWFNEKKLTGYIGVSSLPLDLEWIVVELSIERFNKIGNEGISSQSVDGVSLTFEDNLDKYLVYLDKYVNSENMNKVRFL